MIKRMMVATLAVAALALAGAQGPGVEGDALVYELSQGGVKLGEVGVALRREATGFQSRSYVTLPGVMELENELVTDADGAALSYRLGGSVQGVQIAMDGAFHPDGATFQLAQGGQEAEFELPSSEPLYVVDNNFIDGFQVLALLALQRGETVDVAAIVPQAGALGRVRAELREGTEPVEAIGRTVDARGLDIVFTVGPQTIGAVAWLDDEGRIVALDQPMGAIRFTRVYESATGESPGRGDDPIRETASAFLERTGACVETRELRIESTGATLYGELSLPVGATAERGAPTLLLLPGSGAVDVAGNAAPLIANSGYAQLAGALGCSGYGVLRVAKLGIPPSTGDGNAVTLQTYAQNTADWLAELARTEGVDGDRLGLIGHSEGGLVALYAVAEGYASPDVVVLLATAGRTFADLLREQVVASAERGGLDPAGVQAYADDLDELLEAVRASEGVALEVTGELADNQIAPAFAAAAGLLRSEIDVDPTALAASLSVPTLIVQGLKDVQVREVDGELLAAALPTALHLELPDLTHNLVDTPLPAEAMLLPPHDAVVSDTLIAVLATFLHGTLKIAR